MKNPLVQLIISGAVLGLMCGAVTIHALHISGAQALSESGELVIQGGSDIESGPAIIPTGLGSGSVRRAPGASSESAATLQALQEIVDRLQELKSENQNLQGQNQNLQEQLEETNRDLSELQFRVDSHSESFRPMKFSSDSLFDNSAGSGGLLHPLLPPK